MPQVNTQPAYILHKRNYRESSQILDIFTRDYGRLSLMSRGSRGPKSRIAGNLQLFLPLLVSWQGNGSLPYLRLVECAYVQPPHLSHQPLLCAIYINELLMYLLHRGDATHKAIFDHYHHCLYTLETASEIEIELRKFEIKLLELLGFGLLFGQDADSGQDVVAEQFYCYHVEHGPVVCDRLTLSPSSSMPVLQGVTLLALMREDYSQLRQDRQQLLQLKRLMRYVINFHLDGRALKSRELFSLPR